MSWIPLPSFDEIPDADQIGLRAGTGEARRVIPNTEIAIVRVKSGPRSGKFLFSADTVARAGEFYERVPYVRAVPLENLRDLLAGGRLTSVPGLFAETGESARG